MSNRLTTRIDFFTLLFYPLEISSIPYEKCIDGAEPIKSRIVISKQSLIEKRAVYNRARIHPHLLWIHHRFDYNKCKITYYSFCMWHSICIVHHTTKWYLGMTKHEWKAMIAKNYWTTTAVATAATTTTLKTQQRRREISQNYYGSFKTNQIVDNVGIF